MKRDGLWLWAQLRLVGKILLLVPVRCRMKHRLSCFDSIDESDVDDYVEEEDDDYDEDDEDDDGYD